MNSDRIFTFAIVISIVFHGVLIAHKTDLFQVNENRIIKIPVVLEQEKVEKSEPEPVFKPDRKIDVVAEIKKYLETIRENVATHKLYPDFAQRHGITGKVKISFYIRNDGTFEDILNPILV